MRAKNYSLQDVGRKRKLFLFIILVGVIISLAAAFALSQRIDEQPTGSSNSSLPGPEPSDTGIVSVKGKYMFSGTIVPARAVENEARRADGTVDYAQPFSQFDTFNPDQYDAWLMDFECPMTENDIPYQTQVANTVFNCPDEFAPELAEYFTFANVANNHTRDQGDEGFADTVRFLEAAGIQTIGHWDPREQDEICEVVALPVRLQKTDETEEEGTLPVAFCAWHYFEKDPLPEEIAVMDEYAEIMPVFAFMQVGAEYRATADSKQISVARQIIDSGPEFLIGNSPHWVQNTEVYKGKLIVYSTGNFIFDQLDEETNRGLSIDTEMNIQYDENVQAWLDLGKTCEPRGDNCLEIAKDLGLQKIKVSLDYSPVASIGGYRELTQKAPLNVQAAVEQRANWTQTLKDLE